MLPALLLITLVSCSLPATPAAQSAPAAQDALEAAADAWVQAHAAELKALNQSIWSHPEVGLDEYHAVAELMAFLEGAGFAIERGVAGMPTAFVAQAGSGTPVIGILAEYDALPGMSQGPVPRRQPRAGAPVGSDGDIGHACGHSVFGAGSAGAAAAAWAALREAGLPGTIRLYGTPAEETGIGKVYMARAGLFDDLDAALHWHASDRTLAYYESSKAVISVKFRFDGQAAHASRSPEHGRSALDAVELMNVGVNYLREHLRDDARLHYVITDGGGQPNVVPPRAEVWYYLRADDHAYVEHILLRVTEIASGAATMTRTEMAHRIDSDLYEVLPNRPLSEALQRQLERVGPPAFDAAERAFAAATQVDFEPVPEAPLADAVLPLPDEPARGPASTDVGNVSWTVPTGGVRVACYTLGAPGHSWQVVACTGTSIGEKGMLVAARALAGTTLALLGDAELRAAARADFDARVRAGPVPASVLPAGQQAPTSIR
jgi:aminobenzoyl-glutamate utilization protein B